MSTRETELIIKTSCIRPREAESHDNHHHCSQQQNQPSVYQYTKGTKRKNENDRVASPSRTHNSKYSQRARSPPANRRPSDEPRQNRDHHYARDRDHYRKRPQQLSDGSRPKPRYEQVNTTATTYHKSSSSKTKPCEYELDLQLERRPLSPINKLDPKDPRVKAKVTTDRADSGSSTPSLSKAKSQKRSGKRKLTNSSLAIINQEERFEAINELGNFPMLGESTRTTPSHHSEASRESNMDRERDLSVSTES